MLFVKSYCLLLAGSTLFGSALAAPASIPDGAVRRASGSSYSADSLNREIDAVLPRAEGKSKAADPSKLHGGHRGVDIADGFKVRRSNDKAKPEDHSKLRGGHRGVDIADGFKVRRDNERVKPADHPKLRGGHRGVDIADGF